MEETLSIILILSTGFVLFLGILGVVIWFWIGAVLPSIEYAIEEFKENRGRKKVGVGLSVITT